VILHDKIEEKSKFAGSAQENGPGSALLHSLLKGQRLSTPAEKSIINMIRLRFIVSD
jgi:hypothetical protein